MLACEKAVAATQAVLHNTVIYYNAKRRSRAAGSHSVVVDDEDEDPKAHFKCAELKIIQSKAQIEDPPILFRAEMIIP